MRQTPQTLGWTARWLPFACFALAVSSTLSVLVLQAMTLKDGAAIAWANVPGYVAGWFCFTAMLFAGTVAAVFRMHLLQSERFRSDAVQTVTLILLGAVVIGVLVNLLVNAAGGLWTGLSMILAVAGLAPLLVVRWRRAAP